MSKKTKFYDCACGRKVPLDGIKVMRHRIPGSSEYCEEAGKAVLTPAMEAEKEKVKLATGIVQIKCVYPPCREMVTVKAPPPGVTVGTPQHMTTLGGIPMCTKHGDWLAFYIWAQINLKLQPQRTASGILLPGDPQYNATMTPIPTREQILADRRPVQ